MAYKPESRFDSALNKVKAFVKKEDEFLKKELSHIKSLISSAHSHAESNQHEKAADAYKQIMGTYKGLSREAKENVHPETKHVFNKILLSKINHLLNEAHVHIQNKQHKKAADHYSEIKELYPKLEKEHRAAVSEKCIKLHEKLFETSLT